MELWVISLSPSEGRKLAILQYITLVPHISLTHHESQKIIYSTILFYLFQYLDQFDKKYKYNVHTTNMRHTIAFYLI